MSELKIFVDALLEGSTRYFQKEYTHEELMRIFEEIGKFIKEHLLENQEVLVRGIGLFTLFQQRILVSHSPLKYVVTQKPVFQLANSLASKFRIRWSRLPYEAKLPQKLLNPSAIALKCGITRQKVIYFLYEFHAFVEKALHTQRNVSIPFSGIGTLKITGETWKMDFHGNFRKLISKEDVLFVAEESN